MSDHNLYLLLAMASRILAILGDGAFYNVVAVVFVVMSIIGIFFS